MTRYLLAGGGTAGHVNPLLATADYLVERDPSSEIIVIGTAEGLESRLVPERGYQLDVIPKLPFPRRPSKAALTFLPRFRRVIKDLTALIIQRNVDVVIGFGGYASAPAYLAARAAKVPFVIHEANARPGMANRLGARFTPFVGVIFADTPIRGARQVGLPLRKEIAQFDRAALRHDALREFGLDDQRPVLLVTGGSLGAQRINETIYASAAQLVNAGIQIVHITGDRSSLVDPNIAGYHLVRYCSEMDKAFAVASLAIARSGAATVCELAITGTPSVLVPYPVGNGEQRLNARELVAAGAAILVDDANFRPEWVTTHVLPLVLADESRERMAQQALTVGISDGAKRLAKLIDEALASSSR